MSSATKPLSKTLTIAHSCRFSLPFASSRLVSVPTKPRTLHFSCFFSSSSSSPSSLVTAKTRLNYLSFSAQASEWAKATVADAGEETIEEDGFVVEEGDCVAPPKKKKIFVGNLRYEVDSQRLAMLFQKAGVVEISEVKYNRDTGHSKGYGFVTMSSVEEADKAIEMFNGYNLDGRLLLVNTAFRRGKQPERTRCLPRHACRIYIGRLSMDTDSVRLGQVFGEHGNVVEARLVYNRETGHSRGFGFVTMSSETEMEDAIAALDGQILDGRVIQVCVSIS